MYTFFLNRFDQINRIASNTFISSFGMPEPSDFVENTHKMLMVRLVYSANLYRPNISDLLNTTIEQKYEKKTHWLHLLYKHIQNETKNK